MLRERQMKLNRLHWIDREKFLNKSLAPNARTANPNQLTGTKKIGVPFTLHISLFFALSPYHNT